MKRINTETFYITSKSAGTRNNRYLDVFEAINYLRSMPKGKQDKFGVTCVETYTYFDDDGNFDRRETYECFVDLAEY